MNLLAITIPLSIIIAGCILAAAAYRIAVRRIALSKVTTIPLYKKPSLRLYEIGTLIDGKLHDADVIAVVAEHFLTLGHEKDYVERDIIMELDTVSELRKFKKTSSKEERSAKQSKLGRINKKVYRKLIKDGFYRYNPFAISGLCVGALLLLFYINIGPEETPDSYREAMFPILLPLYTAFGLMALFAYTFHENLEKVIPVLQQILGYKMFFETTEKHRTLRDQEFYDKQMPMMIALGVHHDQWDEMIDRLVELLQQKGS